jgi:Family of unknown function (DUF5677)
MSTLAEEGFLSGEGEVVVTVVRRRYAPWLSEIRPLNRLLTEAQYRFSIRQEHAQEVTCGALYVRTLAHCQAVVLLLERGMGPSAKALMRCAMEGLFNLGACASSYEAALAFLDAHEVDRKKKAKYLSQVKDPASKALLDESELKAILERAEAKIDEVGARQPQVREMAQKAGLEDLYLTGYALLCGAVHSTVADLDQHYEVDDSDNVRSLITEPLLDELGGPFLFVGETMAGIARAAAPVLGITALEECETRLQNLRQLGDNSAG